MSKLSGRSPDRGEEVASFRKTIHYYQQVLVGLTVDFGGWKVLNVVDGNITPFSVGDGERLQIPVIAIARRRGTFTGSASLTVLLDGLGHLWPIVVVKHHVKCSSGAFVACDLVIVAQIEYAASESCIWWYVQASTVDEYATTEAFADNGAVCE